MSFVDRIHPLLVRISHRYLDQGRYNAAIPLLRYLDILDSGHWDKIPLDERAFCLEYLPLYLGVPGPEEPADDPDLHELSRILLDEMAVLDEKLHA